MIKKIIFVADWFSDQVNGGGELNNDEFVSVVSDMGIDISTINSHNLTPEVLKDTQDCHYIFGNFLNLDNKVYQSLILSKINFSIYEHDHKYLARRDPSGYDNYKAPENELANLEFYKRATAIFCQSKLHADTVIKNINLDTIHNLSGNIWSLDSLNLIEKLSQEKKQNKVSIWDSTNPIKNTAKAVAYCKIKKLPYDLVGSLPYDKFLAKIGQNDTFLFFPETMETLCRVVVEARMMNMRTITNGVLGATSEDWFSLKGKELVKFMREKRESIPKYILETIK